LLLRFGLLPFPVVLLFFALSWHILCLVKWPNIIQLLKKSVCVVFGVVFVSVFHRVRWESVRDWENHDFLSLNSHNVNPLMHLDLSFGWLWIVNLGQLFNQVNLILVQKLILVQMKKRN
jgi:hypothetical protein